MDRFLLHVSVGTLPHAQVMRAIELLGTQVAPAVRAAVAGSPVPDGPAGSAAEATPAPVPA